MGKKYPGRAIILPQLHNATPHADNLPTLGDLRKHFLTENFDNDALSTQLNSSNDSSTSASNSEAENKNNENHELSNLKKDTEINGFETNKYSQDFFPHLRNCCISDLCNVDLDLKKMNPCIKAGVPLPEYKMCTKDPLYSCKEVDKNNQGNLRGGNASCPPNFQTLHHNPCAKKKTDKTLPLNFHERDQFENNKGLYVGFDKSNILNAQGLNNPTGFDGEQYKMF